MKPAVTLALVAFALPAAAQTPTAGERLKLFAFDGSAEQRYGAAVDVTGERLAIGATDDDEATTNAGAVYVYLRAGVLWTLEAKLFATDAAPGDQLGSVLQLTGGLLFVGSRGADSPTEIDVGAVYVFRRSGTTWAQVDKVQSGSPQASAWFGSSLSVDGSRMVVGARYEDHSGVQAAGAAYAFALVGGTWVQEARLISQSATFFNESFGAAVAIEDDVIAVGTPGFSQPGFQQNLGSVWIFRRAGGVWNEDQILAPAEVEPHDLFGIAVDLSGGTLLAGATGDDDGGLGAGAVYAYDDSGGAFVRQAKLVPTSIATGGFGHPIDFEGNVAAVGATNTAGGAVVVYIRSGSSWIERVKLVASDGGQNLGFSTALEGDVVVAGSRDDELGVDAGAVYVFGLDPAPGSGFCFGDGFGAPCPCGNAGGFGGGCANSAGGGATLSATGTSGFAADDMVLTVAHLPPLARGAFFVGLSTPSGGLGSTFFDGLKCARGVNALGPVFFSNTGSASLAGPVAAFANSGAGGLIQPGLTVYFQALFRDPAGPCGAGANLSTGYAVTYGP